MAVCFFFSTQLSFLSAVELQNFMNSPELVLISMLNRYIRARITLAQDTTSKIESFYDQEIGCYMDCYIVTLPSNKFFLKFTSVLYM